MKKLSRKTIVLLVMLAVFVSTAVFAVCAQTHEDRVQYTVTTDITSAILPSEGTTQTVNVTVDIQVLNGATVKGVQLILCIGAVCRPAFRTAV